MWIIFLELTKVANDTAVGIRLWWLCTGGAAAGAGEGGLHWRRQGDLLPPRKSDLS